MGRGDSLMNKTLRLLVITWLLIAATLSVFALARDEHQTIIVVHTGESKTLLYNPATSVEIRNETADGNVMLTVQPKESK